MQSEIANGENPEFTSFVGASAAPSQTPAVSPQITPRPCSDTPKRFIVCTAPAIHLFWPYTPAFELARNQCNTTKRATPASNTKKGTRKWLSVAIVLIHLPRLNSASIINLAARDGFVAPTLYFVHITVNKMEFNRDAVYSTG
jgi:hypothetical protein